MKNINIITGLALAIFALFNTSCSKGNNGGDSEDQGAGNYKVELAFPALSVIENPIELTSPYDETNRLFVVSQKGVIYALRNNSEVKNADTFLDISSKVASGGETGLLGLAFHPSYKINGYVYVNYTRRNPDLQTVISRFKVNSSNPNIADASSEEILLTYNQPFDNHNGGKLAFGNDGFLYIAAGDGGSGGDPLKNGQNKTTLLGKILRIDVDRTENGKKYTIPADNPFKANSSSFKEEIYAYGLRNPWRFSFDKVNGTLWAADVGQNKQEEIDIISKGGNYGWNDVEGSDCFGSSDCNKAGLIAPIWTYGRSEGGSITGGYVCRDTSLNKLTGKYIYGDFLSGKIWALSYSGNKAVSNDLIAEVDKGTLSSFGEDSNGNMYILNYSEGKIYKIAVEK